MIYGSKRELVLNEEEISHKAGWFKLGLENLRISSTELYRKTELLVHLQGLMEMTGTQPHGVLGPKGC